MSKEYTVIVHTIAEDGLPPRDYEKAGLIGRVAFIFDGSIYCGWPLRKDDEDSNESGREEGDDLDELEWSDSETAHRFSGVKKWIELPVPGWDL